MPRNRKIRALSRVTTANSATPAEQEAARRKLAELRGKETSSSEDRYRGLILPMSLRPTVTPAQRNFGMVLLALPLPLLVGLLFTDLLAGTPWHRVPIGLGIAGLAVFVLLRSWAEQDRQ